MSDTIRKQFIAEVGKQPGAARVRRFTISTSSVDRDNDTISASGWDLSNYRRNPVVLWAHDYRQLPVAKALTVGVEGGKLVAAAEFADHDFADTVLRMIDGGFLRATSVGFRPTKVVNNVERGGHDFLEQELLEFSIVPVPANPQALIGASAADVATLKSWATATLAGARGGDVALELDDSAVALEMADDGWRSALVQARGFRRTEPFEPVAAVSPADVLAALRSVVQEQIGAGAIARAAAEQVARMRGRVD